MFLSNFIVIHRIAVEMFLLGPKCHSTSVAKAKYGWRGGRSVFLGLCFMSCSCKQIKVKEIKDELSRSVHTHTHTQILF